MLLLALSPELGIFGFRTMLYSLLNACLHRYDAAGKGLVRTAGIVLDEELQNTINTEDLDVNA